MDSTILLDLKRDKLVREGHFAYRSGCHSAVLLDRDRLLSDPVAAGHMGYALAKHYFTDHVETVAAPSIWGAGLAQWVAHFLEPKAWIVYATPSDGGLTIAGNLEDLIRDRRVLIIDNLIISGDTMGRFAPLIDGLGGEVIGVGTLWNSAEPESAGHRVFGLLNTVYDAYPAGECPLCAAGSTATPVPY
jgi:orotate phosphoribosyltransferase